ncbi:MAG: tetratricopeptide repeat protein, partial [Deltaproteobacteria bacterium]
LPHIQDYLLYFRGRAFERSKKIAEAVAAYDLMLELYPASVLRTEVLYRKAGAMLEGGSAEPARRIYTEFIERYSKSSRIPEALLGTGRASVLLGDNEAAIKAASRLLIHYPANRASRGAAQIVSQLRAAGVDIPEYSVEERFRRAQRLFDATLYAEAIKELEIVERGAGPGELKEKALIKKAVALVRLKEYSRVEGLLERYLTSRGASTRDAEALYWLSLSALRQSKARLLEKCVEELSARFPSSAERAGAILFMGRYYEGIGELDRAIGLFEQVASQFRQLPHAEDAMWSIGWLNYRAGRSAEALKGFGSYLDSYPAGKDAGKVLYWMARSLEKTGDSEAA